MGEEIRLHEDIIERIDKVLSAGYSQHHSREEFIISAVEKKLAEIRSTNK